MAQRQQFDLAGCINPSNNRPGFLIPYFKSRDDRFVQMLDRDWNIVEFRRLADEKIDQEVLPPSRNLSVRRNDPAIFAFVFKDGTLICGDKPYMTKQFRARMSELSRSPRAHKEVLEFVGDLEAAAAAIFQIHQLELQRTLEIADPAARIKAARLQDKVARIQLRALELRGVPVKQWNEKLDYMDDEGYLSYRNLHKQIHQLILNFGEVQVRLKLVRSQIGTSPKEKDSLESFGLRGKKIGTVTGPIPVNSTRLHRLRQVEAHVIVEEVKAYGLNEITIQPLDSVGIQKRYLKKNPKKVVRGSEHQDYVCTVREIVSEIDASW